MKSIILKYTDLIFRFFYKVYNYNTLNFQNKVLLYIYTSWIKNEFKIFGDNSLINRDCFLVGGRNIEIGSNVLVEKHSVMTAWDDLNESGLNLCKNIGAGCKLGEYINITYINKLKIGK